MRRILIGLAALVILGVGLVFVAPYFIATDDLQKRVLAQVESATGYRVRVDGPMRITLFPSLDLVAKDVGIAGPSAGGSAEFITARTLKFGLLASGLLSGKVQLTEVELIDPVVTLPLTGGNTPDPGAGSEGASEQGGLRALSLDKLIVRNGTVVMPPSGDGAPGKQITALDAEASLPSGNGSLTFDASAAYDGERVTATGSIGSFAHFVEGGPVPVKLVLSAPAVLPHQVTVSAAASNKDGVFKLAQFQAQYGPHALTGNATYGDDTLSITQGTFDKTPFSGTANLAGDKLSVDVEAAPEGKPFRVTGSLGSLDRFLAGGEAPLELGVNAPDHLPAPASLSGNATYKDGTFALSRFNVVSGEDTASGAASYTDDLLSLSNVTAVIGGRTMTGRATYQDDTVSLDVTVDVDGKPAKVTGSIGGIEQLIGGEPAPIKLAIDAPSHLSAKASVDGSVFYKNDTLVLSGITAVSGPNTVTANGTYKDDTLVLDPITASSGDQSVSGTVAANLAGDVPSIKATLTGTSTGKAASANAEPAAEVATGQDSEGEKNAAPAPSPAPNPLAPLGGETEIAVAPPAKSEAESAAPAPAPVTAPRTRGLGWRTEKLGVLALKGVDADVDLTLNQFVYEKIKIGAGTAKVTLSGGKLSVNAPSLKAYGGGGSLALSIDASGAAPVHRLTVALAGLEAYPFLSDLAEFRTIEGKAAIALDLSASGNSEHALVSSLNGTAKFEFTDGALRGLNVANMLRTLTTGILTGWQYKQEAKTVFSKFGAGFQIANGQAQTDDLRLLGPLVSIGGVGTVDLPAQRLKFRINPFMLASVESQSGKNNMLGFPVPIAVTGPWDNPAIYPDIVGVLENPVVAYQQLDKLGGGLISMPTNLLGLDTGDGGLVEKSVAVPTAITKGVVGGIGQMLGVKKKDAAPRTDGAAPPTADAASAPAANGQSAAQPPETEPAPAAEQQAAPERQAAPKQDSAPGFGGSFGN
ncbi:MAG: AsmA family protein [Methyloceanibacter sp.]|uniref:AsmA family protein n=1 Tax=Methyloceanibacter sp. TaxID=1965321 RepID=UPI003EDFFD41